MAPHRAGVANGAYSFAGQGLFDPVSNLLLDPCGRARYDSPPPRTPADHQRRAAQYHGDGGSSIICDLSGKRAVRERSLG